MAIAGLYQHAVFGVMTILSILVTTLTNSDAGFSENHERKECFDLPNLQDTAKEGEEKFTDLISPPENEGYKNRSDAIVKLRVSHLFTFRYGSRSSKGNHFWFCSDGIFFAELSRKGLVSVGEVKYSGTHFGVYTIGHYGLDRKLKLWFKKLPPLEMILVVKDNMVFINHERYSIEEHQRCR